MDWYGTAVGKNGAAVQSGGYPDWRNNSNIRRRRHHRRGFRGRDGYLITSIPYDENFVLKVDGKETLLFRANTAFLGAKIPSGEHKIVLVYHAPGRTAGSWCSLMGGMLALILVICEKKKQQNGSERAGESKMLQKQRKYYIIRV
ncbi:hypothetical protein DWZ60_04460 [Blautia sp. AF34-10]|nr:hypothetical protein DWZ60_04460 [Blautia sp. AF34-10]RHV79913.1 hypothetical protein DXB02_07065 [Blautia sp. OF11-22]